MVPEHCVSSVLTVSVRGSIGTLNFKTIFSFRLTVIALSLGSIETSFGVISEVFFGFSQQHLLFRRTLPKIHSLESLQIQLNK
jgi:hypothetical protein